RDEWDIVDMRLNGRGRCINYRVDRGRATHAPEPSAPAATVTFCATARIWKGARPRAAFRLPGALNDRSALAASRCPSPRHTARRAPAARSGGRRRVFGGDDALSPLHDHEGQPDL